MHIPKEEKALPHCLLFPHHHTCLNMAWSKWEPHISFCKVQCIISAKWADKWVNRNLDMILRPEINSLAFSVQSHEGEDFTMSLRNLLQELMFLHIAVEHSHYSCWGSVHLHDMEALPDITHWFHWCHQLVMPGYDWCLCHSDLQWSQDKKNECVGFSGALTLLLLLMPNAYACAYAQWKTTLRYICQLFLCKMWKILIITYPAFSKKCSDNSQTWPKMTIVFVPSPKMR